MESEKYEPITFRFYQKIMEFTFSPSADQRPFQVAMPTLRP